jgi:hypothetical protein
MRDATELRLTFAAFRDACRSIQTAVELMREATGSDPYFQLAIAAEAVRTRGVLDRVVRRAALDALTDAIKAIRADDHDFEVERRRLLDEVEVAVVVDESEQGAQR